MKILKSVININMAVQDLNWLRDSLERRLDKEAACPLPGRHYRNLSIPYGQVVPRAEWSSAVSKCRSCVSPWDHRIPRRSPLGENISNIRDSEMLNAWIRVKVLKSKVQ